MKKVTIAIPIYYGTLVIIKANNWDKAIKKYNIEGNTNGFGAMVFKDYKDRYVALFRNNPSPAVIAHEAVHVVNHVFEDRFMKLDPLNDEAQAYLTGWVVEQIHNFLYKMRG